MRHGNWTSRRAGVAIIEKQSLRMYSRCANMESRGGHRSGMEGSSMTLAQRCGMKEVCQLWHTRMHVWRSLVVRKTAMEERISARSRGQESIVQWVALGVRERAREKEERKKKYNTVVYWDSQIIVSQNLSTSSTSRSHDSSRICPCRRKRSCPSGFWW